MNGLETEYYGLTNDLLFKLVFGSHNSEKRLICLINALLPLEEDQKIVHVEILNPFNEAEYLEDKQSIVDIKARDQKGILYNIALQVVVPAFWAKRALYYAAKLYSSQMKRGDSYRDLRKTISISILDEIYLREYEEVHNSFCFRHDRDAKPLHEELIEMHFIELPKFDPKKSRKESTRFEKWLMTFRFADLYCQGDLQIPEELSFDEEIMDTLDMIRTANSTSQIREMIESREKYQRDVFSLIEDAKERGLEEGIEKGLKEGREEGKKEGIVKGIEKGKIEGKIEIAMNLLKKTAMGDFEIAQITGLDPKEVSTLRKGL